MIHLALNRGWLTWTHTRDAAATPMIRLRPSSCPRRPSVVRVDSAADRLRGGHNGAELSDAGPPAHALTGSVGPVGSCRAHNVPSTTENRGQQAVLQTSKATNED